MLVSFCYPPPLQLDSLSALSLNSSVSLCCCLSVFLVFSSHRSTDFFSFVWYCLLFSSFCVCAVTFPDQTPMYHIQLYLLKPLSELNTSSSTMPLSSIRSSSILLNETRLDDQLALALGVDPSQIRNVQFSAAPSTGLAILSFDLYPGTRGSLALSQVITLLQNAVADENSELHQLFGSGVLSTQSPSVSSTTIYRCGSSTLSPVTYSVSCQPSSNSESFWYSTGGRAVIGILVFLFVLLLGACIFWIGSWCKNNLFAKMPESPRPTASP